MTKSDAYFIKCHLYKPGFAPKNVHFKNQVLLPLLVPVQVWIHGILLPWFFFGVASHSLKY